MLKAPIFTRNCASCWKPCSKQAKGFLLGVKSFSKQQEPVTNKKEYTHIKNEHSVPRQLLT